MKTLVFGEKGYFGSAIVSGIKNATGANADICNVSEVSQAIEHVRPDVIINCAGKTGRPNVDWCESNKLETVFPNVAGPLVLLSETMKRDIHFVHVSSGCVFNSSSQDRVFEENNSPNFQGSYYSKTKLLSEDLLLDFPVLILRPRMPFDASLNPRNLLTKIPTYSGLLNVKNSMTFLPDFVKAASELIRLNALGVYNIVNTGTISPYEIGLLYKELVDSEADFKPLSNEELNELVDAQRSNCSLSNKKLTDAGIKMQPIETAIRSCLAQIGSLLKDCGGST